MVSFADLRDIDPFVFRQGESGWFDMYNNLKERGYEIRRALDKLEEWTGSAAEGAKATFGEHERRLVASADTLYEGYKLFHQAGDRIGAAKAKIMEGAGEIRSWNLSVADDGTIFDEYTHSRYSSEEEHIRDVIEKYQGAFREAMNEANRADAEIAAGLRKLTAEAVGLAPPPGDATTTASAITLPHRGTAPADVNKWWDSLSPMQQESLLFTRAAELGMLDGVPALARDRANRFRLAEEKRFFAGAKTVASALKAIPSVDSGNDGVAAIRTFSGGDKEVREAWKEARDAQSEANKHLKTIKNTKISKD